MSTPASQLRFEAAQREAKHDFLSRCTPLMRADVVANHYLAHMNTARDLADLVRARRAAPHEDHPNLDAAIDRVMQDLIRAHREDLGIDLAWPEKK